MRVTGAHSRRPTPLPEAPQVVGHPGFIRYHVDVELCWDFAFLQGSRDRLTERSGRPATAGGQGREPTSGLPSSATLMPEALVSKLWNTMLVGSPRPSPS